MNKNFKNMNKRLLPNARKTNLVVQELPAELLVYDLQRNQAICLNQTARLILEQCDGKTTVEEAIRKINRHTNANLSEEIFWVGLGQLKKNRLLDESYFEIPKVSRRDLMRSGISLTLALPLVTSLIAPSAVNAQSNNLACVTVGQSCFVDLNNMDNCCPETSCTMLVNGFCCLTVGNTIPCDPDNDLCCPDTFCCDGSFPCSIDDVGKCLPQFPNNN
jgi:hypothetical protein